MIRSPIYIRDKEIHDEILEFRSAKIESDTLTRCTVTNSELILEEPCWADFHGCTFRGCTVVTKKLCSQPWYECRWIDCKFIGEFGFALGRRTEDCPLTPGPMVVGCDFSETILDAALFNADLPTIKFPRWPNVTILDPHLHKEELRALKFSPMIDGWWFLYTGDLGHPGYSSMSWSVTFNWDRLVTLYRDQKVGSKDFEPYSDKVRSVLGRLPYVIM